MNELLTSLISSIAERLPISHASALSIFVMAGAAVQPGAEAASYLPWLAATTLVILSLTVISKLTSHLLDNMTRQIERRDAEIQELKAEKEKIRGKYESVVRQKDAEIQTKQAMIERLL